MSNETPAEVLADIRRKVAQKLTHRAHAVLMYLDRLEHSLAAGKAVGVVEFDPRPADIAPQAWSERRVNWEDFDALPVGAKLYLAPPADPAKASGSAPDGWLLELREAMAHCVSAADEGEGYAVSREMLNVMTTLGLMRKVGRGKWAPTEAGVEFAALHGPRTLPIDISGRWYEVPIPVQLHIVSMRDQLSGATATPPASAPEVTGLPSELPRDVLFAMSDAIRESFPIGKRGPTERITQRIARAAYSALTAALQEPHHDQ